MKVLVTGGAGYIGSHLVWEFLGKKCDVSIIDNLEFGSQSLIPKNIVKTKIVTKVIR